MIKNLFSIAAIFAGLNVSAQCPTSSIPTKTCSTGEQIESFTLNSIAATGNSGCGLNGYSSSAQTWSLAIGQTYNFTAITGSVSNLPQAFAIAIDINNDNFFSPSELFTNKQAAYTHTGTITIGLTSAYLVGGTHKMRIICNSNNLNASLLCTGGTSNFGETEDYNIAITCPTTFSNSIVSPSTLCSAATATLIGNGGNTYSWSPSGATTRSLTISTTATVLGTESYTLISGIAGCPTTTASAVATVSVSSSPIFTITGNPLVCSTTGGTINISASGANSYTWSSTTNTVSSNTNSISITNTTTSADIYTLRGLTDFCITTRTLNLAFSATPTVSATGQLALCSGQTGRLTGAGAVTYTWLPMNTVSSLSTAISQTATTTYTVIGANANGCTNSNTISVGMTSAIATTTISGNRSICGTITGTANLTATGAETYTWSSGELGANAAFSPSLTTAYVLTSASGTCSTTQNFTVFVSATNPTITLTSANNSICKGETVKLTAANVGTVISTNATTFSWTANSATVAATTATLNITPILTSTYTVRGFDIANCPSAQVSFTQTVLACVGIQEITSSQVSIYPNPTSGLLTLHLNENLNQASVEVYDALGKLVLKENLVSEINTIKLTHIESGIYIYKVYSNAKIIKVGKLIKN